MIPQPGTENRQHEKSEMVVDEGQQMKGVILTVVSAIFLVGLTMAAIPADVVAYGETCGILPMKPLVPLGCRDIYPICECTTRKAHSMDFVGTTRCYYRWVCIR